MLSTANSKLIRPVLSVSQLTAQVKTLLEEVFTDIYVVGEISNSKVHTSGHWYFSLKDREASIACVCFKNANQALKFRLEDGLVMVAHGKLSVYPPRGAYQIVVTHLEPVGIGDWQLAFEQLKDQLEKEGLLAQVRKRPLPLFPKKIGVVTSLAGAALQDILSALSRRNKNVSVVIAPAKVQGEGSPHEIAQALTNLAQDPTIEVIILARGGGSIEDLWAFNTELVARAVANCPVPIVSGVGHETDITICDLIADLRAPTPTAAAELVARGQTEILEKVRFFEAHLVNSLSRRLSLCRRALEQRSPNNFLNTYAARLHRHRIECRHQRQQLIAALDKILTALRTRYQGSVDKLITLGPLNVLGRGFSIIRNSQGQVIRSISQLEAGERLEALLQEGKLSLIVQSKQNTWD